MNFDFMQNPKWNSLSPEDKQGMLALAFKKEVASDPQWDKTPAQTKLKMWELYQKKAQAQEDSLYPRPGLLERGAKALGTGLTLGYWEPENMPAARTPAEKLTQAGGEMVGNLPWFFGIEAVPWLAPEETIATALKLEKIAGVLDSIGEGSKLGEAARIAAKSARTFGIIGAAQALPQKEQNKPFLQRMESRAKAAGESSVSGAAFGGAEPYMPTGKIAKVAANAALGAGVGIAHGGSTEDALVNGGLFGALTALGIGTEDAHNFVKKTASGIDALPPEERTAKLKEILDALHSPETDAQATQKAKVVSAITKGLDEGTLGQDQIGALLEQGVKHHIFDPEDIDILKNFFPGETKPENVPSQDYSEKAVNEAYNQKKANAAYEAYQPELPKSIAQAKTVDEAINAFNESVTPSAQEKQPQPLLRPRPSAFKPGEPTNIYQLWDNLKATFKDLVTPETPRSLPAPESRAALPPGQGFELINKPEIRVKPGPERIKKQIEKASEVTGPTYPEGTSYVTGKPAPENLSVEHKPIFSTKGKPWKTEKSASRALEKSTRLKNIGVTPDTHEVVPVDGGGFIIERKKEIPSAEQNKETGQIHAGMPEPKIQGTAETGGQKVPTPESSQGVRPGGQESSKTPFEIPKEIDFQSTEEAIAYGKKATPEQLQKLQEVEKKVNSLTEEAKKKGDLNAAMKIAAKGQFLREARQVATQKAEEIPKAVKGEEKRKPFWKMTKEEYADSVGAPKPQVEIGVDASFHQLNRMSEAAKRKRFNEKSIEKRKLREKYDKAVKEWENKVWNEYTSGKFSLNDAFEYDKKAQEFKDSFYLIRDRAEKILGKDLKSPFALHKLEIKDRKARIEYLDNIDKQVRETLAKKGNSATPEVSPQATGQEAKAAPAKLPKEAKPKTEERKQPFKATGSKDIAYTESGKEIPYKWGVVEAKNLVASHHEETLSPNEAYPKELQPRDRGRSAYTEQIARIANKLIPKWLEVNPKVSEGAPVVGKDLVVESGNGRVMGLKRAYRQGTAEEYRKYIEDNADKFGLKKEEIAKFKEPVLVRVRDMEITPEERIKFTQEANAPSSALLSTTEQAKQDAVKLKTLADLVPNEDGDITTRANRPFIQRFISEVIPQSERGAFIDKGGNISADGIKRVKAAIFQMAYDSPDLVELATASSDNNIRNITNGLMQAAPEVAKMREEIRKGHLRDLDITPVLEKAINEFLTLKKEGQTVKDWLGQQGLFEDTSPEVKELVSFLDKAKRSGKKIREFMERYVEEVKKQGDPNQESLWGEVKPEEILDLIKKAREGILHERQAEQQQSLFGGNQNAGQTGKRVPGSEEYPKEKPGDVNAEENKEIEEAKSRILSAAPNLRGQEGSSAILGDLATLGADVIRKGANTFKEFSEGMREHLSAVWEKVKPLILKAYYAAKRIIANQRGSVSNKPIEIHPKSPKEDLSKWADAVISNVTEVRKPVSKDQVKKETSPGYVRESIGAVLDGLDPRKTGVTNLIEKAVASPEWYQHPVLKKIVGHALDRQPLFYETFNKFNDTGTPDVTVTNTLKDFRNKGLSRLEILRGKKNPEYVKLLTLMNRADAQGIVYRPKDLKLRGFSPEAIKAWQVQRDSYDKQLDALMQPVKEMVADIDKAAKEKGVSPEYPVVGTIEIEGGKKKRINLKDALATMGRLRGSYLPRIRHRGDWAVYAEKDMGTNKYLDFRSSRVQANLLKNSLERQGYTARVEEATRYPEETYQALRVAEMNEVLQRAARNGLDKYDTKQREAILGDVIESIANVIKSRGYRGTMIRRKQGPPVEGYITDLLERYARYTSNNAAGIAKAQTAEKMLKELYGKWEDGEKVGGIDPEKDKMNYTVARSYINEQLRNAEKADRVIGLAKSLTTFKLLGYNVHSLAVNITSLATSAPVAIHQYATEGKGNLVRIGETLARASWAYAKFMAHKKLPNSFEQKFLDDFKREGYSEAQYARDAMGAIQGAYGSIWKHIMGSSMFLFGKSEEWIRGTTALAAFREARKAGFNPKEAEEKAIEATVRAHGEYGKETTPMWAWGKGLGRIGQSFYTYMKYPHNYMQMLYDVGVRKKNVPALVYGIAAPAVLSGAAAIPMYQSIVGFTNALLKWAGYDEDTEKVVYSTIKEQMGQNIEDLVRLGVLGEAGVDLSGSLAIGAGTIPTNLIELFGAIGGAIQQGGKALKYAQLGQYEKATEQAAPQFISNILRARREMKGAVTSHGYPVWDKNGKPYIPTKTETYERALGFRSSRRKLLSENTWFSRREEGRFADTRKDIYQQIRQFVLTPNDTNLKKEIADEISKYNQEAIKTASVPLITQNSINMQIKRMTQPSQRDIVRVTEGKSQRFIDEHSLFAGSLGLTTKMDEVQKALKALEESKDLSVSALPSRNIILPTGETYKMSDEEYGKVVKDSEARAKRRLETLINSGVWDAMDNKQKARRVRKIINNARSVAKRKIRAQILL